MNSLSKAWRRGVSTAFDDLWHIGAPRRLPWYAHWPLIALTGASVGAAIVFLAALFSGNLPRMGWWSPNLGWSMLTGIIIMMLNADIASQFEFVQQQWINYGNDFKAGNDKDVILGNHSADDRFPSKAVLQVDPEGDQAPYFLSKIPRLVETRGGDYFFVPSLTALRMIARGVVDPT